MQEKNKEYRYYVYLHRDSEGKVFYVGSGTAHRFKSKCNRSEKWKVLASKGFQTEKVLTDLTIEEAREAEELLIQMFDNGQLVNRHLPMKTLSISIGVLNQFKYSEESPSGLVWNVDQHLGRCTHKVGDFAGAKEARNGSAHRWRVKPQGVKATYAVHRIVWALHHPIDSSKVIDHIDGNPWNNRIENLREVCHKVNARNMKKSRTNKSGVTGVCFKKNTDGNTYWIATWRDSDGRSKMKAFMTGCYGYEEAFRLACKYRKNVIDELNAKGSNYSRRNELT